MTYQSYLLATLIEELAEVIHAAAKCQRFVDPDGWKVLVPPDHGDDREPAQEGLVNELNDVIAVLEMLELPPGVGDQGAIVEKKERVVRHWEQRKKFKV
jgi:hypothetical protein